jgi:hypothetical protein
MENADTQFVPQDYSAVLENTDLGIHINLRAGSENIQGPDIKTNPIRATLNLDNAVNVTISPSSRAGSPGDNVIFTVYVTNTGRYDDNYSLGVDASGLPYTISPSSLSINAGNSNIATLTVTVGANSKVVTVSAEGTYADDSASSTVNGPAGQYVLTTSVDPTNGGSVTLDPAGGTYTSGTVVTATANPASGYEFDHWSGGASGTATSVTITMNSAENIVANFRTTGAGSNGGLPWAWIGLGIVIVIIIIAGVAATRGRHATVLASDSSLKQQTDTDINTTDLIFSWSDITWR